MDLSETIQKLQLGMQACIGEWTQMQHLQLDLLYTNVENLFRECTLSAPHARDTKQNVRQQQLLNWAKSSLSSGESSGASESSYNPMSTRALSPMNTEDIEELVKVLGWKRPPTIKEPTLNWIARLLEFGMRALCWPFTFVSSSMRERITAILNHDYFELSVAVMICLNSFFIGVSEHLAAKKAFDNYYGRISGDVRESASPVWVRSCELLFCIVFSAELLLRMVGQGVNFFMGTDKHFNLLDLTAVISSLGHQALLLSDVSFIRIMRIVRLLRILRIVRIIRVVGALRLILVAVVGAIVPLLWAFVFALFVIYVFGIVIQQQVSDYVNSFGGAPLADEDSLSNDARVVLVLQRLFPSLQKTLLTLFMSITSGVSWGELWEPLQHISSFLSSCLTCYVAFMVLGVLNVLTGLFVHQALQSAENDSDTRIRADLERKNSCFNLLKQIFKTCDTKGSGRITFSDFHAQTQQLEVREMFNSLDLDVLEAEGLFNLLDLRCTGEVGIDEFVVGCMRLKDQNKHVNLASLLYQNKQTIVVISDLIANLDDKITRICRHGALHESSGTQTALTRNNAMSRRLYL